MTFAAQVKSSEGRFCASLLGEPDVAGYGDTRDEAIDALRKELTHRIESGEIVAIEVFEGLSGLAGKYADDEALEEICREAYRQRDLDRDRQFGNDAEANE